MGNFSEQFLNLKLIAKEHFRKLINYKHSLLLADPAYHDDLYVVSFPKSGATWMNFLMANIHLKMSGDKRHVTFFNVHNFVPDIHFAREAVQTLPFPGFRVLKSHSGINPYYRNVIYIVRDPRDVLVSYYHFLLGLGKFNGDIKTLIRSKALGVTAWCEHVRGWMEDSSVATRFIYIRYEDLKINPLKTLKRIYGFIGYDIEDDILLSAIDKSSFEKMKGLENDYGYGGRDIARQLNFMRKGKTSCWQNEIAEAELNYI